MIAQDIRNRQIPQNGSSLSQDCHNVFLDIVMCCIQNKRITTVYRVS